MKIVFLLIATVFLSKTYAGVKEKNLKELRQKRNQVITNAYLECKIKNANLKSTKKDEMITHYDLIVTLYSKFSKEEANNYDEVMKQYSKYLKALKDKTNQIERSLMLENTPLYNDEQIRQALKYDSDTFQMAETKNAIKKINEQGFLKKMNEQDKMFLKPKPKGFLQSLVYERGKFKGSEREKQWNEDKKWDEKFQNQAIAYLYDIISNEEKSFITKVFLNKKISKYHKKIVMLPAFLFSACFN